MMDGVLSIWYRFINGSGCVILICNERKTVKVFIFWTQRFCFSSLLRHSIKFVKWPLPCVSFCVLSQRQVYRPFIFNEKTVSGIAYLCMLQNYLFPQLNEFEPQDFIWQHDCAPHFLYNVRDWMNYDVPRRWIARAGPNDMFSPGGLHGLPISQRVIFFLWGHVKDHMYLPPLHVDLPDLRKRIVAAVVSIAPDLLT